MNSPARTPASNGKKPKLILNGNFVYPIIVDTREQQPFKFEGIRCDKLDGGGPLNVITIVKTLPTGDYSIGGFESKICVERKSLADLYGTLGQGRARFERELERMAEFPFAAVVIEADWHTICLQPPPHTKVKGKTVFRSILAWSMRYPNIHWFPAGDRKLAEITTFRLLERFLKEESNKPFPALIEEKTHG